MTRNSLLKSVMISSALSIALIGCGSSTAPTTNAGSTDTGSKNNTAQSTIDGKAVDGYLQFATVCLDINQDGYCQNTEPNTQTDKNGTFALKITSQLQAQENYDKAMLLVYGGKDVDTGMDFNGKLLAPKDGKIVNVTPITTLVAKAVQKELKAAPKLTPEQIKEKIQTSRKRVAQALDIAEEDMDKDPVAEQKAGKENLIKKALQLQKAVDTMLVAEDTTGQSKDDRAEKIYEALINGLDGMKQGDSGVETLFGKTLQKAKDDAKTKALIGGENGLKLGKAAQEVAKNLQERFDNFDQQTRQNDDFLQKIATVTAADVQKIKIDFDNGDGNITGKISIDDQKFQNDYDWSTEFIRVDLQHLGVMNPSNELLKKLKDIFQNEGAIKPGTLFNKTKLLANTHDTELLDIYQKIKNFQNTVKVEKEKESAQRENQVFKINTPMTIFTPEEDGYSKVTFNDNKTLTFEEFQVQEDGTFSQNNGENSDFIYDKGNWVEEQQNMQSYKVDATGAIILPQTHDKVQLSTPKDISGQTTQIPNNSLSTVMPKNAKMGFVHIEKTDDTYSLDEVAQNYDTQKPYSSIGEFIQNQCGTRWFEGDDHGGIAFKPTGTDNSCDPKATQGELVYVSTDENNKAHMGNSAGKWEIKDLSDGIRVLVVKPSNLKRFDHGDHGIHYPLFSLKDGQLYRGDLEPKGSKFSFPAFNEVAMRTITSAITENWDSLKNKFNINQKNNKSSDNSSQEKKTVQDNSIY